MKALTSPSTTHPTTIASFEEEWELPPISGIDHHQIAAFGLTDDEVEEGACEILTDFIDNNICKDQELPHYTHLLCFIVNRQVVFLSDENPSVEIYRF